MAYHLTGTQAHRAAGHQKLTPVVGGLERVATSRLMFEDSRGRFTSLPIGHKYRITGTKDGNGYVLTYDDRDELNGTRYLTAEVGCKLC